MRRPVRTAGNDGEDWKFVNHAGHAVSGDGDAFERACAFNSDVADSSPPWVRLLVIFRSAPISCRVL